MEELPVAAAVDSTNWWKFLKPQFGSFSASSNAATSVRLPFLVRLSWAVAWSTASATVLAMLQKSLSPALKRSENVRRQEDQRLPRILVSVAKLCRWQFCEPHEGCSSFRPICAVIPLICCLPLLPPSHLPLEWSLPHLRPCMHLPPTDPDSTPCNQNDLSSSPCLPAAMGHHTENVPRLIAIPRLSHQSPWKMEISSTSNMIQA